MSLLDNIILFTITFYYKKRVIRTRCAIKDLVVDRKHGCGGGREVLRVAFEGLGRRAPCGSAQPLRGLLLRRAAPAEGGHETLAAGLFESFQGPKTWQRRLKTSENLARTSETW